MTYQSNLNKPIGQFTIDPTKYAAEGWYDLGGKRGQWYFRRRDPVIITDAHRQNPVLVHVNFITRADGYLVAENKDNGFAYPAVPPGADRVWPVTMFHPIGAKYT